MDLPKAHAHRVEWLLDPAPPLRGPQPKFGRVHLPLAWVLSGNQCDRREHWNGPASGVVLAPIPIPLLEGILDERVEPVSIGRARDETYYGRIDKLVNRLPVRHLP